jgi:hypothetical protein
MNRNHKASLHRLIIKQSKAFLVSKKVTSHQVKGSILKKIEENGKYVSETNIYI